MKLAAGGKSSKAKEAGLGRQTHSRFVAPGFPCSSSAVLSLVPCVGGGIAQVSLSNCVLFWRQDKSLEVLLDLRFVPSRETFGDI